VAPADNRDRAPARAARITRGSQGRGGRRSARRSMLSPLALASVWLLQGVVHDARPRRRPVRPVPVAHVRAGARVGRVGVAPWGRVGRLTVAPLLLFEEAERGDALRVEILLLQVRLGLKAWSLVRRWTRGRRRSPHRPVRGHRRLATRPGRVCGGGWSRAGRWARRSRRTPRGGGEAGDRPHTPNGVACERERGGLEGRLRRDEWRFMPAVRCLCVPGGRRHNPARRVPGGVAVCWRAPGSGG
jgi:hypothetical protein